MAPFGWLFFGRLWSLLVAFGHFNAIFVFWGEGILGCFGPHQTAFRHNWSSLAALGTFGLHSSILAISHVPLIAFRMIMDVLDTFWRFW